MKEPTGKYMWELVQHDGTTLDIPPDLVEVVKRRMGNKEAINTKTMVIPFNQIKFFRQTSRPFSTQPLLEEVAQVFHEPLMGDNNSIQSRWVKKHVTHGEYAKKYSFGYKRLEDEGGMIVVAFKLPTHLIDVSQTPYLTDEEMRKINNNG